MDSHVLQGLCPDSSQPLCQNATWRKMTLTELAARVTWNPYPRAQGITQQAHEQRTVHRTNGLAVPPGRTPHLADRTEIFPRAAVSFSGCFKQCQQSPHRLQQQSRGGIRQPAGGPATAGLASPHPDNQGWFFNGQLPWSRGSPPPARPPRSPRRHVYQNADWQVCFWQTDRKVPNLLFGRKVSLSPREIPTEAVNSTPRAVKKTCSRW